MKQRMEEPYTEGVATHGDPESCAGDREAAGEALTGARAGPVLSREKCGVQGADEVALTEGNTSMPAMARAWMALRGRRPAARLGSFMRENRESPCLTGDDGGDGSWRRTESSWSRVPRDGMTLGTVPAVVPGRPDERRAAAE